MDQMDIFGRTSCQIQLTTMHIQTSSTTISDVIPQGTTTYKCPVCGYDKLARPPKDDYICDCCGTQFDYYDIVVPHGEIRHRWCMSGGKWYSKRTLPPNGWNPVTQLTINLGYRPSLDECHALLPGGHTTSTICTNDEDFASSWPSGSLKEGSFLV
jgi:ribosomal protein L37AE/L43A